MSTSRGERVLGWVIDVYIGAAGKGTPAGWVFLGDLTID
jgi:hypothetical protein